MAKTKGSQSDAGDSGAGELQSGDVVRTALIDGATFRNKAVQYVEIDGLAMVEGDIVLGTVEEVEARTQGKRMRANADIAEAAIISGSQFRWPNCQVPYEIDASLPNQARVTDAIAHWNANTGFRFIPKTAAHTDYVAFVPASGCSSAVGRQGGRQTVNLGPDCSTGNAIHEMGHVVGLWHEQSREDRDSFVVVHWENILAGKEFNFNQHISDGDDVGAYDYGSIMHYPRDAFTKNGQDTIVPVTAGASIGQRTALSAGDIAAANVLCPVGVSTVKEVAADPITRKEIVLDPAPKMLVRDPTRKEIVLDPTLKEGIADTRKELAGDPTFVEQIIPLPGPQVIQGGGQMPFALQPHQAAAFAQGGGFGDAGDVQARIQQLDAALVTLAANISALEQQYLQMSAELQQALQDAGQG